MVPLRTTAAPSWDSKRQAFPTLSQNQISAFKPYTLFASAAYCNPSVTRTWTCGRTLLAYTRFGRSPSGGNGGLVQYWYVGYDPTQDVIIVAHEGTNSKNLTADLTNLLVTMDPLDSTLFPDVPADVLVHTGYQLAHARTAPTILSNVKTALEQHPGRDIVITGHSLGAVLSLLDAVYLPMHLPDTVKISTIGYGLPRLGNKAFADYVDANVNLTHITYQHDPFPTLPFRLLGFQQPSHEVHIDQNNNWVECPGQENQSTECIDGAVPDLLIGRFEDHEGPYDGVVMGLGEC
ncbi:lipase [Peniophora sp. CONT]|nr:lipase [Peniophora sp. CONT]